MLESSIFGSGIAKIDMDEFEGLGIIEGDEITVSSKYDSIVATALSDNTYIPGRIRLREEDMTFLAVGQGDIVTVQAGAHTEAPEEPDEESEEEPEEEWVRVKCAAKTKSGRKCKKWAAQGSKYCKSHQ